MTGKGDMTDPIEYSRKDKRFLWHPFTPMKQWLEGDDDEPGRLLVAGEGFELIDARGRRFIDGFSSMWCNLHGHRVPQVDAAVRDQLGRVAHTTLLGHASIPSIELAERLVRIAPRGLEKVFYSDSGATAVEVALKMAFQFWQNRGQARRRRFLAIRESYHGDTLGAVGVGGIEMFHEVFRPLLFDATFVDCPNRYHHPAGERCGAAALEQIDRALADAPGEYCAVIVEPLIQAAGGMLTHPPGFLRALRELTARHDVLLIADEVATGFCRTGKLFACEHESVRPDLMCLGKGLTAGYLPVAATLTTAELFDEFCGEPRIGKMFDHGHTYTGNPLGCAAAVAGIDLIFSSGLPDALPRKVEYLRRRLAELADHPNVGDIRQCGMMAGVELVARRGPDVPFAPAERIGAKVCLAARRRGLIIRPLGPVVVLMPAPAMDNATLARMMDAVVETIREHFGR